jgi:hypothetical protein
MLTICLPFYRCTFNDKRTKRSRMRSPGASRRIWRLSLLARTWSQSCCRSSTEWSLPT